MDAVKKFIVSARKLHAEEKDLARRWEKMTAVLAVLLTDPSVKEQSKDWPTCAAGGSGAKSSVLRRS